METHSVGAELFQGERRTDGRKDGVTGGQTDRHDKANCLSPKFLEVA